MSGLYLGTAWPAIPALLMTLLGAWGLRGRLRPGWGTLGVLALALLVRAALMPLEQLEFDGHEAEYRDLLLGEREMSRGGTLLYPAMQLLYRGMGLLGAAPWTMTALSLALGLLSIGALIGLVGRLVEPRAGLAAGLVLALWGNHAFWSSSAYNVILPHAMGVVALWALAVLVRGGPPLWSGLLAGGAAALAVTTRVELALVAPLGLLLLAAYRPPELLRWAPGLLAGAILGGLGMQLVLSAGPPPGAEQQALSWSINQLYFAYFEPMDAPWQWPGLLVGAGLVATRARALGLGLLGLALGSHLAFAHFDDYGFRHLLTAQWALAGLLGGLALSRWAWPLLALALAGVAAQSWDISQRFYASEEDFAEALAAAHPELPVIGLGELPDCALICEDFRVVPEGQQRSHFNLLDPREAEALRAETGCVAWLVGVQDYRWSSRAVRDRALRTQALYAHEARAVVKETERGYVGLLMVLGARRNPGPLDGITRSYDRNE